MADAYANRHLRVTSAFTGLCASAMLAIRADMKREWRAQIVRTAMDTLGHDPKTWEAK
ncbi:hypothetical protein [Pandoraea sp. NPDC087047]|uniref:hypothetical protein n=1 Tax=Pandoraea sp. NPDC087047 TaxID=3364390 RepID=UPI00380ADE4E